MRTTVTLADDVAAAVDAAMGERGLGRSEAVNELIRAGLAAGRPSQAYVHRTYPMASTIDVSNVGEVLDLLDQWDAEDARPSAG